MATFDDQIRSVIDVIYAIPATVLNLHPYSISIVQITNTGGSRPGVGGARVKTITPLVNTDGYNIQARRVSSKDITLSGNTLKDTDMVLGPIVFPYSTPNYTTHAGGVNFNFFDPANNSLQNSDNYQLYFLIAGPDLNPNGNYFEKIYSVADSSLSYRVYVRNLGAKIP